MKKLLIVILSISLGVGAHAEGSKSIRIVGSSTVFPFSTIVAERFAGDFGYAPPIVEATGSGGGLKLFCGGLGENYPDVTNSSRKIKSSEIELCAKNSITDILEIKFGYDGIVLAQYAGSENQIENISTKDIYLALTRQVATSENTLAENKVVKWQDINSTLPDFDISVYGPPPTSGTRDAFVELVMQVGCSQASKFDWLTKEQVHVACSSIREDGAYIEVGENDNLIVNKLAANPQKLGIFGYSFLAENQDKVVGIKIDGIAPSYEAIADFSYPISRALYFYVKVQNAQRKPELLEFVEYFVSEDAVGEDGYLTDTGLIPLTEADLYKLQTDVAEVTEAALAAPK